MHVPVGRPSELARCLRGGIDDERRLATRKERPLRGVDQAKRGLCVGKLWWRRFRWHVQAHEVVTGERVLVVRAHRLLAVEGAVDV
jgi:hypothetical protein